MAHPPTKPETGSQHTHTHTHTHTHCLQTHNVLHTNKPIICILSVLGSLEKEARE